MFSLRNGAPPSFTRSLLDGGEGWLDRKVGLIVQVTGLLEMNIVMVKGEAG